MASVVKERIEIEVTLIDKLSKELKFIQKKLGSLKPAVNNIGKAFSKLGAGLQDIKYELLGIGFMFVMLSTSLSTLFNEQKNFLNISQRMAEIVGTGLAGALLQGQAALTTFGYTLLNRLSPDLITNIDLFKGLLDSILELTKGPMGDLILNIIAATIVWGPLLSILGFMGIGLMSLGKVLYVFAKGLWMLGSVVVPFLGGALSWLLANPIVLLVAGVIALATAWITNWGDIRGKTIDVIQTLMGVILFFGNVLWRLADEFYVLFVQPLIVGLMVLKTGFFGIWDWIVMFVERSVNAIIDIMSQIPLIGGMFAGAKDKVSDFFNKFKLGAQEAADDTLDFINNLRTLDDVAADFEIRNEGINKLLGEFGDKAKTAVGAAGFELPTGGVEDSKFPSMADATSSFPKSEDSYFNVNMTNVFEGTALEAALTKDVQSDIVSNVLLPLLRKGGVSV